MAFPNEHAARLRDPDDFDPDSFTRITREAASFDGREYGVIIGELEDSGDSEDQAFRYPIADWSEADARKHAEDHDAILFEPAEPLEDDEDADDDSSDDDADDKADTIIVASEKPKLTPRRKAAVLALTSHPVWAINLNALRQYQATWGAVRASDVKSFLHDDHDNSQVPKFQRHGPIAIIHVSGPITKEPSFFSWLFGGASTQVIMAQLQDALGDETIHSIVLNIDSPGGSVDGLAELGDMLLKAREEKPILAQTDGMAASAAYYIASQATSISSHRTDLVGSIGTRMVLFDTSKMFENEGIRTIPIDTGVHKSTGLAGVPITDEQIVPFQDIVDFFFEDFLKVIVRGRNMGESKLRALADGRVFVAPEALASGLIDQIATLQETVDAALTNANNDIQSRKHHMRAQADTIHRRRQHEMQKISQK